MTSKFSFPKEDFSCPVCHDIFEDPVLLSCSHSFCKACLQKWWTEKETNECPVCKKLHPTVDPPCNLALKNLCETITQKRRGRAPKRQRTSSEDVCSQLHTEEVKLFCTECQQPVCLTCTQPGEHSNHSFRSIREAALDLKKDIKRDVLDAAVNQLKVFTTFKATCDTTAVSIKAQTMLATGQIREHFRTLHRFLHDEEETRLSALQEEEQQKSQMMTEKMEGLNREISTLSHTIRVVKEELGAEHFSFLQNYKATARLQFTRQAPQPIPSEALPDVAKHLGNLTFRVWDKMKELVSYHPVILNPNTAHSTQKVCRDMTSVDCAFMLHDGNTDLVCAMGSEGFDSGTHSWDVEVGDCTDWGVGVVAVKESGNLFWNMEFSGGEYRVCYPGGVIALRQELNPWRIRVRLDCNRGKLSFSDPHANTHLHTITHSFTDTLLPYIYNADDDLPLAIMPGKVTVTVDGST